MGRVSKVEKLKIKSVLSKTFDLQIENLEDYRYLPLRTQQPIYYMRGAYFTASVSKPLDMVGGHWELFQEQTYAQQEGLILWVATNCK